MLDRPFFYHYMDALTTISLRPRISVRYSLASMARYSIFDLQLSILWVSLYCTTLPTLLRLSGKPKFKSPHNWGIGSQFMTHATIFNHELFFCMEVN